MLGGAWACREFGRGMTDGASQRTREKQGVCKQDASVREAANLRGSD